MAQYKAKEAFELEGAQVAVDQLIDIDEVQAADLGDKVELVTKDEGSTTSENPEATS